MARFPFSLNRSMEEEQDSGLTRDLNANVRSRSTGEPQLDKAVHRWLTWDKNRKTRAQVELLVEQGRVEELRRRFGGRMSFGTAGLRAPMGAGFSRINDLTVIQSTQGLYRYLCRCFPDLTSRGVVVGYDTRAQEESGCTSERLGRLTAAVMLCKDVPVHLFSTYIPTPFVPYAVRMFGAAAGVMVTASHNPKEDNGYKVYWYTGAQISSPHDKEVLRCIEESQEPWSESCWDEELVENSSLRRNPLLEVTACYMEELKALCFHRDVNIRSPLKFVHSSFHGVGHRFVHRAFQVFGFPPPIAVPEQKDPDPNFPSVHCPNPEEGESVLELSLRLAEREKAGIVLATDPDADRLAVAEHVDGCSWKVFTGNELAALLGWWMLFNWKETHPAAEIHKVHMLATCVSSNILRAMADLEGFSYQETLPGFKWIGKRMYELANSGGDVIFAFEESIGFLCGSLVPDKDGVSAAVVVAEMAAYLQQRNISLHQQLITIYQTYGYHISRTSYVLCHDPTTVHKIFSRIRHFEGEGSYPTILAGHRILHVRDVTTGYDSSQPDQRCVLPVSQSQMISFTLLNGVRATLRTSGTEPKIKFYTEYCAPPGSRDVSALEVELQKVTSSLVEDFLEPEKNKLIRRSM